MAIQDNKKGSLISLGYTGALQEMEKDYYEDQLGLSDNFNTARLKWLASKGFASGSLEDRRYSYLKSLALTGTVEDMGNRYWSAHSSYSLDNSVNGWMTRVLAAGGSVSITTQNAVNALVLSLKNAGVWNSFRRLNLCCGNFQASLVPLINSSGSLLDTAVNLTASDYSESTGWNTDGSTKYINTGYTPSEATGGISIYLRTSQTSNSTARFAIGASSPAGTQQYAIKANKDATNVTVAGAVAGQWGGLNASTNCTTTGGLIAGQWHVVRRGTTAAELSFNGVSKATSSSSITPASATVPYFLFCVNSAGSPIAFVEANTKISAYGLDTGMTLPQMLAYYNAMQTFQTAIGRQV